MLETKSAIGLRHCVVLLDVSWGIVILCYMYLQTLYYVVLHVFAGIVSCCVTCISRHCIMCYMYLHALWHSVLNVSQSITSCYVACIFRCYVVLHGSPGIVSCCVTGISGYCVMLCYVYLLTVCHAMLHVFPHNQSCCVTCVCRCVSVWGWLAGLLLCNSRATATNPGFHPQWNVWPAPGWLLYCHCLWHWVCQHRDTHLPLHSGQQDSEHCS